MDSPSVTDLVIIGAGFSGICALIRFRRNFPHATVKIFEEANDIGGTWAKNTYPGLSCDIPSQLYSYSFALNPDWSTTYATQPEILDYIHRVVLSHGCNSFIHLGQQCTSADWLDNQSMWRVELLNHRSGERHIEYCRTLITAVGFSDIPNGPEDIQAIERFSGKIFHSANWDHSFDFRHKNVLVVGNGCSANQFIPWLLEKGEVESLVQITRSGHWIAPKENGLISPKGQWIFRHLPLVNRLWRLWLAVKFDLAFPVFTNSFLGRSLRKMVQNSVIKYMCSTAPASYHPILIPTFPFGAKRAVMDHGYLKSLHDHKIKLIQSPSLEVVHPLRVRDHMGETHAADVIILANGFKTQQLLTPMTINGLDGSKLPELWQHGDNVASAYMGVCVPDFPNLFLLTGPNTLPSGHSTLISIECSVEYIMRVIRRIMSPAQLASSARTKVQVKREAHKSFNKWIERRLDRMVYTNEVYNWYTDRRTGKNTLIWPGSQFGFWWSRCLRPIQWVDFVVTIEERKTV